MIHPSYRNELKYLISPESRIILSRQLERILKRDHHVEGKGYTIKSLYFDNIDDQSMQDNLMGAPLREKFRIRFYNDDDEYIRLEKKVKHLNKGFKISSAISREETESILRGDCDFLKSTKEELLKEFYVKLRSEHLKPKLIATYFREPFLYRPGNVRVTLDYDLRYSRDVEKFLERDTCYLHEASSKCLLEIKYDEFLPDLIGMILKVHCPLRTANSKYVTGRMITGA